MALQRLLHETKRCFLVPGFRDVTLENLALVIDRSPQIHHLAIELDVYLVEVPAPMAEPTHVGNALPADVTGEHRAEPVPPEAHRLMADVDAALVE